MSGAWKVLGGWGLLLVVFAAVQLIFTPSALELAPLAGAGVGMVLIGVIAFGTERRGAGPKPLGEDGAPAIMDSAGSLALAAGVAVFVVGWEAGPWLMGIGGGLILLGVGALIREHRAARP